MECFPTNTLLRLLMIGSMSCSTLCLPAQSFRALPLMEAGKIMDHGNGVALADYDQDGYLDLFLVAIAPFDPADPRSWSRLLKGGPIGFTDVTAVAGLSPQYNGATLGGENGVKTGASWGDYDNDGFPDLMLTHQGKDQLYHNEGNGTFLDVTVEAGIRDCGSCYSTSALWWDYDQDGFLDVYINDWTIENRLYHNNQDGTFTELGAAAGLDESGSSFTSLPFDIDRDGDPDLYVVNDFGPNAFYLNLGNGQFEEQTRQWGLYDPGEGMGVDLCDCNFDGNFDIYLTNIWRNHPNPFFLAGEDRIYSDQAQIYGLGDAGWGWGARFFDMDNDKDEDLYVVNQLKWIENTPDFNRLFEAEGPFYWESAGLYGLDSYEEGHGLEVFDHNLDGDLDLIVTNWGAPPVIYQNNLEKNGNWVQISLEGTQSNRNAYGAVVRIKSGGQYQHRLHHGANFLGQSVKPLHFGLGTDDSIDELLIFWPSGRIEKVVQLPANEFLHFREGEQEEVVGITYGTPLVTTAVTAVNDQGPEVKVSPNPFSRSLVLDLEAFGLQPLEVFISNPAGELVLKKEIGPQNNIYRFEWEPGSEVPAGIYFVEVRTAQHFVRKKIIKI